MGRDKMRREYQCHPHNRLSRGKALRLSMAEGKPPSLTSYCRLYMICCSPQTAAILMRQAQPDLACASAAGTSQEDSARSTCSAACCTAAIASAAAAVCFFSRSPCNAVYWRTPRRKQQQLNQQLSASPSGVARVHCMYQVRCFGAAACNRGDPTQHATTGLPQRLSACYSAGARGCFLVCAGGWAAGGHPAGRQPGDRAGGLRAVL